MNTPAYFCIDNFTTHESSAGINSTKAIAAKVYPNPAGNLLNIDLADNNFTQLHIIDIAGNVVASQDISSTHVEVNTTSLSAGTYILKLYGVGNAASMRFIKK